MSCLLPAYFLSFEQLLGRSIDLNSLLCQRLGSSMLKAIDLAVAKFESSDLCGIVVSSTYLILLFQMYNVCVDQNSFRSRIVSSNSAKVPHPPTSLLPLPLPLPL